MDFVVNNILGRRTLTAIRDYHNEPEIVIPESLKIQEISNFHIVNDIKNSQKIKKIVIPKTVKYIDSDAFANFFFTDFEIPKDSSLEHIGEGAFSGCAKLKSIYIPSCIEVIASRAFLDCKSLKKITFGDNSHLKSIDFMAFGGSGIKNIKFPTTLDYMQICTNAFFNCINLTTLDMSNAQITRIGTNSCFLDKNLTNISFPETLVTIDDDAFRNVGASSFDLSVCHNLQKIGRGAFSDNNINQFVLPYFSYAQISENIFAKTKGFNTKMLLNINPFIEITKEKAFSH